MADPRKQSRSRIVVETKTRNQQRRTASPSGRRNAEVWAAISIIVAAGLATFGALYITSRPFDPMNATVEPQQAVPFGPSFTPSPKPSSSTSPTPTQQATVESSPASTPPQLDDATIQSNIEKTLTSDPALSGMDISTLVENGRVTIVGSVKSTEMKQRVERTIGLLKGVTSVDNQLVITAVTP
jgi:BON domain